MVQQMHILPERIESTQPQKPRKKPYFVSRGPKENSQESQAITKPVVSHQLKIVLGKQGRRQTRRKAKSMSRLCLGQGLHHLTPRDSFLQIKSNLSSEENQTRR